MDFSCGLDDAHSDMHKNSLATGLPTGSAYAHAYYTVVTRSLSASTIIEAATALLFPTLTKMQMHGGNSVRLLYHALDYAAVQNLQEYS